MSTIEERVVAMNFKGDQFLAGIDKSLQKLQDFNNKLKLTEGAKSFDNLSASAQRMRNPLNVIADGVQHISDKFKTMGIVGVTALSTVTSQAVSAGERLVKSLTIQPILDGFREYETNLNSIQTILANTQAAGTKLSDVTAALDELNHYSDQTIYNFSEMAKNIGTFTAAGVALKPAVSAIKGIANLAALSGSNSEQAAGAMYQLSQAISAGRVSLQDWNSVVNAGMGGTVFQRALALTAEKMGTLEKGAVKLTGKMKNVTIAGQSFRESITAKPGEESWLTSEVLTKTLAQFTGDLTDAQLAAEGFNKAEIKAIQAQARMAKAAATEVKTLSQLLNTVKESVGSGWAQTWKIVFGDFEQAKKLFTGINNVIGEWVQSSADARNKVLDDWAKLGGRTAIINAIGNSFKALVAIVKPIRDAFREVFPPATGKQLADISKTIENFTKNLTIGGTTANKIKRVFAGFFSVIGIGWDILKQVAITLGRLVGIAFDGGGGFLDFAAKVGDFLVKLRQAIKDGKGLENFFKGLGDILAVPLKLLKIVGNALAKIFEDVDGTKAIEAVDTLSQKLEPLGHIGEFIAKTWLKANGVIANVSAKLFEFGNWVAEKFAPVSEQIANAFQGLNFEDVTRGLNTGMFAGLLLMFKQFFGGKGGGGFLDNINEAIEGLTSTLKTMQAALVASAILQIAVAIGVLAVSLNILSKIDTAGLTRGTVAMASLFAQLSGAVILLNNMTTFKGAAKLPFIAGSMILLGSAIYILATAMQKLSTLDWESLGKGLTGVTVLLAELVVVANLMPKGASFVLAATSMVIMAAAIRVLSGAVQTLGGMSWEDMARGLVGVGILMAALVAFANTTSINVRGFVSGVVVLLLAKAIESLAESLKKVAELGWAEMARGLAATAAGLGIIAGALKLLPPSTLLSAAAIFVVAASLGMIGDALKSFAQMSWSEFGKSMAVLASSLLIIAAALAGMEAGLPGAAALIVTAGALTILVDVLADMAKMSWSEFGKSMAVLGASLLIIAVGLAAMEAALPGAAALIVAAGALAIIAPVLVVLGNLSWESILKGLAALAGLFVVLGVAAAVLTPVIPSIMGLAISIAAIGVAMLAAGAGIALFGVGVLALSVGLAAIATAGVGAATAIVGMIAVLLGGVPTIIKLVGAIVVGLLDLIIELAPKIGQAFLAILLTLIEIVKVSSPKIIDLILQLLSNLVDALVKYAPHIQDAGITLLVALLNGLADRIDEVIDAGVNLIVAYLKGIAQNVHKVADAATDIVVAFIEEVGKNAVKIADAGMKMIVNFVNGLADSIRNNTEAMRKAGANLALAIIDGMTGGLASGIGRVVDKAKELAKSALNSAKDVLGIHSPSKEFERIGKFVVEGFVQGLDGGKSDIDNAFETLRDELSYAIQQSSQDVADLTAKLKKLTSARHKDKKAIAATKAALAQAKKELAAEKAAYEQVTKALKDKQTQLGQLADQQDQIAEKLYNANQVLADAIRTRDDYNKAIKDQFDDLPDVAGEDTTLASYVEDLRQQIAKTQEFATAIQKLRDLGLNDELYKDLLSKGPASLPFINDVLAAGQEGVDALNNLTGQLDGVAVDLGNTASSELYQAGVDMAQGLVDGLKSQYDEIEKQMDALAESMIAAIKKALGIKSPSKEFKSVGEFSVDGLIQGLTSAIPEIEKTSAELGKKTIDSLRESLSEVPAILDDMDMQPTIRPVLDLSDVKRGFGSIGSMTPSSRISVGTSYSSAKDASAGYNTNKMTEWTSAEGNNTQLNYTQNNYSPKAISPADTYRQTKNQLSVTKGVLARANTGGSP